jgi:hypothetical protein
MLRGIGRPVSFPAKSGRPPLDALLPIHLGVSRLKRLPPIRLLKRSVAALVAGSPSRAARSRRFARSSHSFGGAWPHKTLVVGVGLGGSGAGSLGLRPGVPIQGLAVSDFLLDRGRTCL